MAKKRSKIELIGSKQGAFLETIKSIVDPSSSNVKLYDTRNISYFKNNENAYNLLAELINYNERRYAQIASIFNAIFTQKTDCFALSRPSLNNLMKNDENHNFDNVNQNYYKSFMIDCKAEDGIWQEIYEQNGSNPAFLRLRKSHPVYKILCEIISEDFLEISFQNKHKYYVENMMKEQSQDFKKIDKDQMKQWSKEGKEIRENP